MQVKQLVVLLLLALGVLPGSVLPVQAGTEAKVSAAIDQYGDPLPAGALARLGPQRYHHGGQVRALTFTPDGKSLVGYTFSALVVWDAKTCKIQRRLPFPVPLDVDGKTAVCPGTALLATAEVVAQPPGRFALKIHLWDLEQKKKTRTLSLPGEVGPKAREDSLVSWLAFTSDGKHLLLSNDRAGWVQVVEIASGQVRIRLGRDAHLWQTVLSPDGNTLAVLSLREAKGVIFPKLQLWDLRAAKLRRVLPLPSQSNPVDALAFSPDGKLLALSIADHILLCDAATGAVARKLQPARPERNQNLAFTPDGKTLVAISQSKGTFRVWEVNTGQFLNWAEAGPYVGRALAIAPDGRTMALGSRGEAVLLWDLFSEQATVAEPSWHDAPVQALAFAPDGKALVSSAERESLAWDLATGQIRRALPGSTVAATFSPDGKHVAIIPLRNQTVRLWKTATADEQPLIYVPGYVSSAAFAPNGRSLITLDQAFGQYSLRHWNIASHKQQAVHALALDGLENVLELAATTDGNRVAIAFAGGGLSVYDVTSDRQRVLRISVPDSPNIGDKLCLSPDGRILTTGGGEIRSWELVTGKEIAPLKAYEGFSVTAQSRDGRFLAGGGRGVNQAIRVWDLSTGTPVVRFDRLEADVTALSFAPGNAVLAAGLHDGSILTFDISRTTAARAAALVGKDDLESLWTDLGGNDVARAHQALWKLVSAPDHAVPFLKSRLRPVPLGDRAQMQRWINDLESPRFAVRQAAARELQKHIGAAVDFIRDALKKNPPLETGRRLQQILKTVDFPGPEAVRTIRAIMVLERIGGAEARTVLETLAQGVPTAHETDEAKASLQRMR